MMLPLMAKNLADVLLQMCYLNSHLGLRIFNPLNYNFYSSHLLHSGHFMENKYVRTYSILTGF